MTDLPEASVRFSTAACRLGLELDIHVFPEGTKTSSDAARAVGCDLSQIAKSLVFMADDQPVVALMPGDRRIDPIKLAYAVAKTYARGATLEEARGATGFAVGGTPAFGYPQPLEVLIDQRLTQHAQVWSAAGTATTVYPIATTDLIEASGARIADLASE